ncbi:MAG: hypothetical protein IIU08_03080 [Clostridia bacterium]|nr:hypothetical protein [Clostridia bacterium]
MGKRLDRAFEVMKERNRLFLEEAAKKDGKTPDSADLPESPEDEERRRAEEKLRAYREANGLPADLPDADLPDGPADLSDKHLSGEPLSDEREEGERKAKEFHKEELGLEKGDIPALILSAMLVFGPIFLILGGILVLAWIFLH